MNNLSINSIVQRKDDHLIVSELDNEMVMMDLKSGSYLSLNPTGCIIWNMIEEPIGINEIIEKLTNKFSVDYLTCTEETIKFLNSLAEKKALRIS